MDDRTRRGAAVDALLDKLIDMTAERDKATERAIIAEGLAAYHEHQLFNCRENQA